jgi:hypothetical protein
METPGEDPPRLVPKKSRALRARRSRVFGRIIMTPHRDVRED